MYKGAEKNSYLQNEQDSETKVILNLFYSELYSRLISRLSKH